MTWTTRNSVRRTASASRPSGRCAIGLRPSLDPAASPARPNKKNGQPTLLTGPAPSGMTCGFTPDQRTHDFPTNADAVRADASAGSCSHLLRRLEITINSGTDSSGPPRRARRLLPSSWRIDQGWTRPTTQPRRRPDGASFQPLMRNERMQLSTVGAPVRRHDGTGHPPPVTHRQAVLMSPGTNLRIGRTTTRTRNGAALRSP